jgi:Protein of unknown function (DUF3237)
MTELQRIARDLTHELPHLRMAWQAAVEIGERSALGLSPGGERFLVPILGGQFWGGPGYEALQGTVLPGGADRQLLRPDGVKELDALYEMRVQDGAVLTVRNQVRIDETVQPRYARSLVTVTAPDGPWGWLNRRCFVGSLRPLRPQAQAVLVSVFELT